MNAEVLKKAGIDYERGVKRFMGRAQLYEKVLAKFPRDGAYARACAAWEQKDYQGLLANAHELKGMCGNLALTAPYHAAEALVQLLRRESCTPEEIGDAYQQLQRAYQTAYQAVVLAMEEQP